MSDTTLYEFTLYDANGEFLRRYPCIPPFEVAPDLAVVPGDDGNRYFVLMEDLTYHETAGVHFLPQVGNDSPKIPG